MTRMKRSTLLIVAAVVVLLIAAAAFMFMGGKPADKGAPKAKDAAAQPRPALTVTVARPETSELTVALAANGNVAAWQEASIGSESNGLRLAEVRVNVGDVVKKGQVLATFSAETVQADMAQARASLAEARATAADAAANAARARTLQQTGALSQQQINQYQTSEQTAKARVEAAEAVLAAQQVRGRNTQVLAPDDGVISSRTATVGSVLSAGTELFRLIRQGRLEWRAEVTSAELGRVAVGTPAIITSASGAQVKGQVRSIAPTVDPQTRAALVYVDILDVAPTLRADASSLPPKGALAPRGGPASLVLQNTGIKAGMFARGEFQLGRTGAITVPQAAVVPRDGFNHLLLLQPDNRVAQLKVETGRRVGDRVEITSKLPDDARVVVQGAGFLNDGDLVRVVDAPAAPAKGAAGAPGTGDLAAK
ncbi:efflux RND transporter periplasmic adaptor subunit [Variovorax sp. JS1663]|uniref:efflux RND transporter periplasmic adaptor subunit n=1 Tax=Variovorax sp. JS1663 TaxID=1851577 RepID=UPI000B3420BC|nr:efflux RND transporter periplasmic adaptor subunit [Variovorax sp. JS1663]OUM00315.1 efflux transporter periplasmic adaptor subunit [Variovorax sp. JS1663]